MSWAKIDDQLHAHPKTNLVFSACPAALGLHLMAMSYSACFDLDGFVDDVFVASKIPGRAARKKATSALVDGGIWHRDDARNGWNIHDWAEYNGDAETRRAAREAKVEAGRKGAAKRWQTDSTCHSFANGTPNGDANGERVAADGSRAGARPFPSPSPTPLPPTGGKDRARTFNGKPIPSTVLTAAQAVLADLNRQANTSYRPFTDTDKLTSDLSRIVGAMLEDTRITIDVACRMTTIALRGDRYWEPGRFHAGHVFGKNVRSALTDQALASSTRHSAADQAAAYIAAVNRNVA